jgi:hypothetical protein
MGSALQDTGDEVLSVRADLPAQRMRQEGVHSKYFWWDLGICSDKVVDFLCR